MNRITISKHHRTYAHAESMLAMLIREDYIKEGDYPRIVPYTGTRQVNDRLMPYTNFAIDIVRR